LANKGEVEISEIGADKFALIKSGTHLRHVIDGVFEKNGIEPKVVFEAEECNSIASYVASDFGISLIPRIPPLVEYNLSFLRIKDFPIKRTIYLIWKTDSGIKPIIKKIQESLNEHFGSQPVELR
jgi:DNA-binding transcriptional LysR family regulator